MNESTSLLLRSKAIQCDHHLATESKSIIYVNPFGSQSTGGKRLMKSTQSIFEMNTRKSFTNNFYSMPFVRALCARSTPAIERNAVRNAKYGIHVNIPNWENMLCSASYCIAIGKYLLRSMASWAEPASIGSTIDFYFLDFPLSWCRLRSPELIAQDEVELRFSENL